MTDSSPRTLRERLLDQDPPLPAQDYQEYRMHLDAALSAAVRREQRTRWTMIGLWIATFASMGIAAAISNSRGTAPPEWYGILHAILLIATWVETLSYFVRFRPALTRARDARQTEVLRNIEQQIAELARRLENPPSAPQRANETGGDRISPAPSE